MCTWACWLSQVFALGKSEYQFGVCALLPFSSPLFHFYLIWEDVSLPLVNEVPSVLLRTVAGTEASFLTTH